MGFLKSKAFFVFLGLSAGCLEAQVAATWTGLGGSTDWNNFENWSSMPSSEFPDGPTSQAIFGSASHTSVMLGQDIEVFSISFENELYAIEPDGNRLVMAAGGEITNINTMSFIACPVSFTDLRVTSSGTLSFRGALTGTTLTLINPSLIVLENGDNAISTLNAGSESVFLVDQGALGSMTALEGNSFNFEILQARDQTLKSLNGTSGATVRLGSKNLTLSDGISDFGGVINGSGGGLTIDASSTTTLTGVNTYSGTTNISGTLALSGSGSLVGSGPVSLNANTAVFDISGSSSSAIIGDLTGVTGSTVQLGSNSLTAETSSSTSFSGTIEGTGGFTKAGTGTFTFLSPQSYLGATTVSAGTLQTMSASVIQGSVAVDTDATLDLAGFSQSVTDLTGAGGIHLDGATLQVTPASSSTRFAGIISSNGGVTKSGSNELILTGANTYTGETEISNGTLSLGRRRNYRIQQFRNARRYGRFFHCLREWRGEDNPEFERRSRISCHFGKQ